MDLAILGALVLVAVLIAILILITLRRQSFEPLGTPMSTDRQALAPASPGPISPRDLRGISRGDMLAVLNPSNPDGEVLLFGDGMDVSQFGEEIGPIPGQLAAVAVGSNALVQAGIALGEQSGTLVRLTPESARLFKQLQKTVDAQGAFLGVLRGAGGKFEHVIRFNPAMGLQALSGITGALSAIAMQAQLAAIERALASLADDVRVVQQMLDNQTSSSLAGVREVLEEVYESVRATGAFSQIAWDQVAPLAGPVFANRDLANRRLRDLITELGTKKSTSDRRAWLKKNSRRLFLALSESEDAERSVIQYAGLRLWRLTAIQDSTLPYYQLDLEKKLRDREWRRGSSQVSMREALEAAGETHWFDWLHSPIDSRAVEKGVASLIAGLQETGLLTAQDVQILTSPELQSD